MAGSGNIKVLRIARQLYKRCCHSVSYGNHMSVHMAIGFLFLGGGKYEPLIKSCSQTFLK